MSAESTEARSWGAINSVRRSEIKRIVMHGSSIASVVVVILIGTGVHADQSRPDNRPAIGSVVPFTVRDLQAIKAAVPVKMDSLKTSKGIYYKLNEPQVQPAGK